MAAIYSDTLAAGASSSAITTTPGALLTLNTTLPVIVVARNSASDPVTYAEIYRGQDTNESVALVATSDAVVIRNPNTVASDIEIFESA